MTALGDAISRAILDSVDVLAAPSGDDAISPEAHLALIRASADAEREVRVTLRQAVESARAGGVGWSAIGAEAV